jgi:signal transduction histidine kinase
MTEQLLELIDLESTRLATLVDEILLTSQIDGGRVAVSRTAIDPRAVLGDAVPEGELSQFVVDVAPGTPFAVGDPERLRQVLANLVENAIKYGQPPFALRARGRRDSVRFEVSDSGAGIPDDEQQRIFEKFYRLDAHLRHGVRGTGLGLYICRELVQRMQGRVGVDSGEGRGATFWLELPRHQ